MAKQVRVLGTTDETSICECCGKTNLKKVVVLEIEGEIVRYGCDCAGKALRHTGYYAGQKVKAAAIWAMAPQERREMAGYNAEAFKFQAAA
jgi:hypothetical protein